MALQRAIHRSVIEHLSPGASTDLDNFPVFMERFPYPPYKDDVFLTVIQGQMPFIIMLSLIFIALNIPKEIVLEKEKKLKVCYKN